VLTEEATELAAGGVQRALLFLGVAVVDQWSAFIVKEIGEHSLHGNFPQSRVFVEIANDLSA
jgi:hypothetical protein